MDLNSKVAQDAIAHIEHLLVGTDGLGKHDPQAVADVIRRSAESASTRNAEASALEQLMRQRAEELLAVELPLGQPSG